MKKTTGYFALLAFVAVLSLAACKGGGKKGDGKTYDISFNSIKANSFTNKATTDVDMQMEAMGMKMNIKMQVDAGIRFDMLPDSGDAKQMKMTYDDIKMSMDMDNPMLNAAMKKEEMKEALDKVTGLLKGISLTILVDKKNGTIKDVIGKEEVREEIMHRLDSMTDGGLGGLSAGKGEMEKSLRQLYDKDQLQNMLGTMFAVYKPEPVKIGDEWSQEITNSMNEMKMKMKLNYKLVDVKDGYAEIEMKGKVEGVGATKEEGMKVEADLSGTQSGTIKLKLDNGLVTNSDAKMEVKGDMKTMGVKIPIKMKANYTIKAQ